MTFEKDLENIGGIDYVCKSRSFKVPVIAIGNITVGGTGKTPHVEYLIRLLKDRYRIGVLSRGYRRKTRSFNGRIQDWLDWDFREPADRLFFVILGQVT